MRYCKVFFQGLLSQGKKASHYMKNVHQSNEIKWNNGELWSNDALHLCKAHFNLTRRKKTYVIVNP